MARKQPEVHQQVVGGLKRKRISQIEHSSIKRSFFERFVQGIKTNSEQLISTDQHVFSDAMEVWLHFVL